MKEFMKKIVFLFVFILMPSFMYAWIFVPDTMAMLSGQTSRCWENKAGDGFRFRYDIKNRYHYQWDRYSIDKRYNKKYWDKFDVFPRLYFVKNGQLLLAFGNEVSQKNRILKITNERLLIKTSLGVEEYRNVGDISKQITVFPPYRQSFVYCKLLTTTEELTEIVNVTVKDAEKKKMDLPDPFKVNVSIRINSKGRVSEIELIEKNPDGRKYEGFYSLLKINLKNGMIFTPDMDTATGETFDSYMNYTFPIQYSSD